MLIINHLPAFHFNILASDDQVSTELGQRPGDEIIERTAPPQAGADQGVASGRPLVRQPPGDETGPGLELENLLAERDATLRPLLVDEFQALQAGPAVERQLFGCRQKIISKTGPGKMTAQLRGIFCEQVEKTAERGLGFDQPRAGGPGLPVMLDRPVDRDLFKAQTGENRMREQAIGDGLQSAW